MLSSGRRGAHRETPQKTKILEANRFVGFFCRSGAGNAGGR